MVAFLYLMVCFMLPNIICQIANRKNRKGKKSMVWTVIFWVYCVLVLHVTEIGTIWDYFSDKQFIGEINRDFFSYKLFMGEINLDPFSYGITVGHLLNIVMFMPLGFLLPFLWKNYCKIWKTAFVGLFFSFLIEICQLFCYRVTDVDDLIMNTLGSIVGFLLWKIFGSFFRKKQKKTVPRSNTEPIVSMILGIAGMFFLYH